MRSYWHRIGSLTYSNWCLYEKTVTQGTIKAETEAMQLQETTKVSSHPPKARKGQGRTPLQVSGACPADLDFWTSRPQNCYCDSSWFFVMTALGKLTLPNPGRLPGDPCTHARRVGGPDKLTQKVLPTTSHDTLTTPPNNRGSKADFLSIPLACRQSKYIRRQSQEETPVHSKSMGHL